MNIIPRSEVDKIKAKVYEILPEGVTIIYVIIALSEIIKDFSELEYEILKDK